ncbi:MAG: hypothetical protein MRZ90_05860 [Candidatus Gastranaerophilales bacterium]|nr:hypothetical protein [Candidatus Gastranaerophilales bacterium]
MFFAFFQIPLFRQSRWYARGLRPLATLQIIYFFLPLVGAKPGVFFAFFQIPLFRQSRWYARGLRPLATLQIIYFFLPLVGAKPGVFIVLFVKSFVAWIYFRFIIGFALLCLLGRFLV